jgi:limonene-1,2-epoxide hydrolase
MVAATRAKDQGAGEPMTSRLRLYLDLIEDWKRRDIDAVLDRLTDDIVWHYAASAQPPLRSKRAARKFLENFADILGEVRWRVFDAAEVGDRLFVEGVDEFFTKEGVRVATPYAGVIEFRGDLICGWRDYFDGGVADAMRGGAEAPPQVEALIDRPVIA